MILQCPACNARYAVPDHAIGANGRNVRCVKCAHTWFVEAAKTSDEELDALLQAPPEAPEPEAKPIAEGSNVPALIIKPPSPILTGALFACMLLALLTTVFTKKPQWFGFHKIDSVVLADLMLAKQPVERGMEYAISGKLINTGTQAIVPPTVRITLVDKEGNALQYWEPVMPEKVGAQEPIPFTFGPLATKFTTGNRLVVELGNSLQLALRTKP